MNKLTIQVTRQELEALQNFVKDAIQCLYDDPSEPKEEVKEWYCQLKKLSLTLGLDFNTIVAEETTEYAQKGMKEILK